MKPSIREFQTLMTTLYGDRDRKRGIEKTLLWMQTESGELLEAFLKGDLEGLKEEVADVLAWLCSVCNLLEIDLEAVAWEKYPFKCPKCSSSPCNCIFH
ncbi:MAG: nucleotide pyrophosphohydrolase [Candidatus Heimdallarchaeota archaeon]|nr:MAG: nucleotide pyrophosphohydrolase [Candidatus Heimdallarchaeota archaeon]